MKKICAIMAVVLSTICVCGVNMESTFAAENLTKSQKRNYKKAIEKYVDDEMIIGDEKKNVYFSFYDIDRDGKKEMMIDNDNNTYGSGCIIDHNGKLMTVLDFDEHGKLGKRDFYYRNLTVYKKGVVMHSGVGPAGGYMKWYQADAKGKLKEIASWSIEMEGDKDIYLVRGKKVGEKIYNDYIKNFSEVSNIKRYSYTKKNIERYF